jgi:phage protein D
MSPRAEEHVASYEITVEGQVLAPEQRNRIKEIRIVDHLRLPDVCTVRVAYPQGDGVDSMPFDVGRALEVRLGATQEQVPQPLFKGEIITIEPEFGSGGCAVTIRAFDRSHRLHRSRVVRTFQNQTSSDIVSAVVGEAGLSADCDASGEAHTFIQQDNETDWDFIWRLAERVGFEFVVEDEVAHFRKPATDAPVELTWPSTLRSFRPRVTAVQQASEVTLRAYDPKTKQTIVSQAQTPEQIAQIGLTRDSVATAFPSAAVHIATEPVETAPEGDALAQALLDKLANGYISADGVAPGNPRIKAGTTIRVDGVGQRFGGTYRVATSTHVLRGGGGYETHFANAPSHTILAAVGSNGGDGSPRFGAQLVIGEVTNNDDPDGMGRVRVSFPALSEDVEGAWARIATLGAGAQRGTVMLPQVGDEVLVGFEHDDTSRPYVLGSLFNGVDQPGDDLLDGQKGSFVVMSDAKLHLQSKDDATLKTDGALTITVTGDTTVDGTGALQVKGRDVSVQANAMVTIEGTSGLTLKCGGSQIQLTAAGVTVSGPMISLG